MTVVGKLDNCQSNSTHLISVDIVYFKVIWPTAVRNYCIVIKGKIRQSVRVGLDNANGQTSHRGVPEEEIFSCTATNVEAVVVAPVAGHEWTAITLEEHDCCTRFGVVEANDASFFSHKQLLCKKMCLV